jgi:6-phosphofructo-2-kinase / fructose-2,6-biphosphatase 2
LAFQQGQLKLIYRGKTYTARKIVRYLTWLGHRSRIFNVGNYRRNAFGADQKADFFDPENEYYCEQRTLLAIKALRDMIEWIHGMEVPSATMSSPVKRSQSVLGAGVGDPSCIAVYDATNSSVERRKLIYDECATAGVKVIFIENVCDDMDVIMNNIKEVKLSSPDYVDYTQEAAIEDFKKRIAFYEKTYQPISSDELNNSIAFLRIVNVGKMVSFCLTRLL